MENRKKKPVRMCVACRGRFLQEDLLRLQCKGNNLVKFLGEGRSFYVCENCINTKRFINYISKKCNLNKESLKNILETIN